MKTQPTNSESIVSTKVANVAVYVHNGRIDEALRRFKKKMEKAEILDIYKEHQAYIKPSDKKHQKNQKRK